MRGRKAVNRKGRGGEAMIVLGQLSNFQIATGNYYIFYILLDVHLYFEGHALSLEKTQEFDINRRCISFRLFKIFVYDNNNWLNYIKTHYIY